MLDVHPLHEAVFTWKGFLFHIATIVVGLFIAVGLEQAVEYVHHHHQRHQIEEQLRPVFSADIASDGQDIKRLADMRAALTSLRADIERQRRGQHDKGIVAASPNRIVIVAVVMPGMAPYEAAKKNGTLALLPVQQIRMYGHIYFFRQVVMDALTQWRSATTDLAEFTERFNDYPDDAQIGGAVLLPDMTTLRPTDLDEYLRLVATLIKRTDMARSFLAYFSSDCQAILGGANDDVALTNRTVQLKVDPDVPSGASR